MRIAVVGAGAMGSLYAGMLARGGEGRGPTVALDDRSRQTDPSAHHQIPVRAERSRSTRPSTSLRASGGQERPIKPINSIARRPADPAPTSPPEIWLIGRSRPHIDAIRAAGLRMTFPGSGEATVPLNATTDPAEPGIMNAVIFLTKTYDAAEAARTARPLFGPDTLALALQNGLGAPEAISGVLGPVPLACGVSEVGGDVTAPGHLTVTENVAQGRGYTRFGRFAREIAPGRLEALAAILEASGLRAEVLDDVQAFVWTKLAMAGTMSSLSALTRLRIGPIASSPEGWRLIERMVREIAAVAAARGIALDVAAVLDRARHTFAAVPGHVPSMAADLRQHRRTENDALAAMVARLGAESGVLTPMCSAVSEMIALVERHPGESIW